MKINEIFYSLQGEGYWTGTPSVFVRFSGCNLKCAFCDTDFAVHTEMSEEDIIKEVCRHPASHVVITGGEPLLQLSPSLVARLHHEGKYVQIETNGTRASSAAALADWVTCSPKSDYFKTATISLRHADELKVVVTEDSSPEQYSAFARNCKAAYLQPCDTGDKERNALIIEKVVEFIKQNPTWRLSLQIHKTLGLR